MPVSPTAPPVAYATPEATPLATTAATAAPTSAPTAAPQAAVSNARTAATRVATTAPPTQTASHANAAPAAPTPNNVSNTQSLTQVGVNTVNTNVDPPGPPKPITTTNNHNVGQQNLQLAQNQASVQITGNGNTVTIVQVIEQVAQNIATALFGQTTGNSGNVNVSQSGLNVGSNDAEIPITGNGLQQTVNQTIFQVSTNQGTTPQPAGTGQTSTIGQINGNAAINNASVVITGNNNVITIIQTIIQIAQNLSTTIVPNDGLSSATGSTAQSNINAGSNVSDTSSISGTGNTVSINQTIFQSAGNVNNQLVPGIPPPTPSNSSAQPQAAPLALAAPTPPPQAFTTVALGVSGGGTAPPELIHLTATVTGNAPTGTVSFLFFYNGGCAGSGMSAGVSALSPVSPTSSTAISSGVTLSTAGSYSFTASYSGDPANAPTSSGCLPFTVP